MPTKPKNHGKPITKEAKIIKKLVSENKSTKDIANTIQRTVSSTVNIASKNKISLIPKNK
jgi:DNA-binding CsgD family transcriptional regulator